MLFRVIFLFALKREVFILARCMEKKRERVKKASILIYNTCTCIEKS